MSDALIDDILKVIAEREKTLETELARVRAYRASLGKQVIGGPAKATKVPHVAMTAVANDTPSNGLPAPHRKMSAAARKKLSLRTKARWKAAKAAGKSTI